MESHIETIFFVIKRIKSLAYLNKVFDLIHHHHSTKNVPYGFMNIEEVHESRTELYVIILSYLYSLFDKTGINIMDLHKESLSQSLKNHLDDIEGMWNTLKNPVTRIRHNLGFHGIRRKQLKNTQKAADEIDEKGLVPKIFTLINKLEALCETLEHEIQSK